MSEELVVVVRHVRHGQDVQLRFPTATRDVDREKYWKGNEASHQAGDYGDLESESAVCEVWWRKSYLQEAKEQVAV